MSEVAKGGRTVLFVSHNMNAIRSLCRRGVLLLNGALQADTTALLAVEAYLAGVESASSLDLSERHDRRGRGRARLRSVAAHSVDGGSAKLATGQPARFVFTPDCVLRGLSCSFTIYNAKGVAVAHLTSARQSPQDAADGDSDGTFVCEIDELPLLAGEYRLNAALSADSALEDHVEGALFFDVFEGLMCGRAAGAAGEFGAVAIAHRWRRSAAR